MYVCACVCARVRVCVCVWGWLLGIRKQCSADERAPTELRTRTREFLLQGRLRPRGSRTQHLLWTDLLGRCPLPTATAMTFPAVLLPPLPADPLLFLHLSLLPLGCPRKLLPTCPNSCLPPSHCALFLSWGDSQGGAQLVRLSQPWKSPLVYPKPLNRTTNPGAQAPQAAQRSWCLTLPGLRGLAM